VTELSLDDLAVFVRVIERGSFAAAARELSTPTSTVSRAVARLEERGGVRLLQRTTRHVRPTSDGRELYAAAAPAVASLRATAQALEPRGKQPRGRLRVSAASDLCSGFLSDVVVAFAERYPLVQLEFLVTNERVNLVEEGLDVALRASTSLTDSTLVVRKLGEIQHGLYASPKYLERHGSPQSPADLANHHSVVFRGQDLARTWQLESADGPASVALRGRLGGDDMSFVRAMLVAGGGIGLLPRLNCAADEASGRLVRVLPSYHARGATLYLLYPSKRQVPARVSAFREFVAEAFAAWSSGAASA
jgi:DNA-binding transcriptional LysR family regulator